jgi:hypothetical protein
MSETKTNQTGLIFPKNVPQYTALRGQKSFFAVFSQYQRSTLRTKKEKSQSTH